MNTYLQISPPSTGLILNNMAISVQMSIYKIESIIINWITTLEKNGKRFISCRLLQELASWNSI